MPKSKVRKKNDFTINPVSRTPVKVKAGPSSVWFVVLFCGLMLVGLACRASMDGQSGAVELRDRLCFHDHGIVAHDALALAVPTIGMNLSWPPRVTRLATSWSSDHTDVIHPHWG
jgi:hypothetical protein